MKKFLFLITTIFYATIHAMSFESVPKPLQLEILELVANNETNLTLLLRSKRVSKYWHALITNKKTQKKLKDLQLTRKKKEDDEAWSQLINNGRLPHIRTRIWIS